MRSLICAAAASLALMSGSALAVDLTDEFDVKLTITDSCTLSAPNNLDFGDRANLDTELTNSVGFTVNCTANKGYILTLASDNVVNGVRQVAHTTVADTYIPYYMYSDSGYSVAWDEGTEVSKTGTGADDTTGVYVKVPAMTSTPTAGAYSDTVKVTLSY